MHIVKIQLLFCFYTNHKGMENHKEAASEIYSSCVGKTRALHLYFSIIKYTFLKTISIIESKRTDKETYQFSFTWLITFSSVPAKVVFVQPAPLAIPGTLAIALSSSGSFFSTTKLKLLVFILRILPLPFPRLPVIAFLLSRAQHPCQPGIWCPLLLPTLKVWNASLCSPAPHDFFHTWKKFFVKKAQS